VWLGSFKYFHSHSHYTWPAPLDKLDTAAGRLAAGGDYRPPGSTRSVPRRGAWPQLYDVARDPGEAYDVAKRHAKNRGAPPECSTRSATTSTPTARLALARAATLGARKAIR